MNDIVWNPNELYHHGIKGQKWGVRRFQNLDGTLTSAGKGRYESSDYDKHMRAKPGTADASKNPLLGRRFNAPLESRIKRGKELRARGRTMPGAVGRAIGRELAVSLAAGAVMSAVSTVAGATAMNDPEMAGAITLGVGAFNSLVSAGVMAHTVTNVTRTVQDLRDMSDYDNSKHYKNYK